MADGETPGIGVMLGKGVELRALGRVWHISAPNQNAKQHLEKLAARTALENVRQLKDVLEPAAYKEAFDTVTGSLGNYRTWRPGWQAVVFDPGSAHLFLWSLLKEKHPEVGEADVMAIATDAPEEVAAALAQVLPDFFQLLLEPVRASLPPADLEKITAMLAELPRRLAPTATSST